jgi:hypothetical protein
LPQVRTPNDISNRKSSPDNVVQRWPGLITTVGFVAGSSANR